VSGTTQAPGRFGRRRRLRQAAKATGSMPLADAADQQAAAPQPRPSWARLLHKIFEVDPLLCPHCQVEMRVVSVITEPAVIDKILAHIRETGGRDPFAGRGPPKGKPAGAEAGAR
jgi:hypothetical protein